MRVLGLVEVYDLDELGGTHEVSPETLVNTQDEQSTDRAALWLRLHERKAA